MQKKRTSAEIQKKKQQKIEKVFKEVTPLIKKSDQIILKKGSTISKIYSAAKLYITGTGEDIKEACIVIYNHFKIRPYRDKDRPLTDLIKQKLKKLKYPAEPAKQLNLFKAAS